jgi:superfamily II DNA helicase RecQ
MRVKVVTLAYDENLRGFPQEPLDRALSEGSLLETREHFFVHQGVPHLALVLVLEQAGTATPHRRAADHADPGDALPETARPLYRNLRGWRNERAKTDGVPAYALFRNAQLAEICRRAPRSLAALREIDGIGEATCRKYGAELLALIPADYEVVREASSPEGGAP